MLIETPNLNPVSVTKRAFFIAYEACGGPAGMGFLQARQGATEEDVWNNVVVAGDYPVNLRDSEAKEVYGDYVMGRMMKLGLTPKETGVEVSESTPRADYQAWCKTYPEYSDLVEAAIKSLTEEKQPS